MAPEQVWTSDASSRTLRDAVRDIWVDASMLIQQHVALAAKEAGERTSGLSVDLAASVAAMAMLHAGLLAMLASAGFALHAAGLSPWLTMLFVAVLAMTIGLALALWARARLARRTTPRSETVMALRETSEWLEAAFQEDRP